MKTKISKTISRQRDGFTLAELLIVVAIIAVLVAVSIPIFVSRLEDSRESTDIANMRSAKAEMSAVVMDDNHSVRSGSAEGEIISTDDNDAYKNAYKDGTAVFVYDAEEGELFYLSGSNGSSGVTGYGEGTSSGDYSEDVSGKILYLKVTDSGIIQGAWSEPGSAPSEFHRWKEVYLKKGKTRGGSSSSGSSGS